MLGLLMLVLGGPRMAYALATHEVFGAEATVAGITACLGLLVLISSLSRR